MESNIVKTISVIVINKKGKILALKRSGKKNWYPKMWDIISGKFNKLESPDECFNREVLKR